MATTNCSHHEKIEKAGDGIEHGTCKICGQVRQYNTREPGMKPKITKLGRINGVIVLPGPKDDLLLADQEGKELPKATKEGESVPAPAAEEAVVVEKPSEDKDADAPAETPPSRGRQWYIDNKKEMIEDLLTMDYDSFREKWQIKRQIVSHLKVDKLYKRGLAQLEISKGKPIEEAKAEEKEAPAAAPPKLTKRQKRKQGRAKYLEQHKAEIIQAYQDLVLKEFLVTWHISPKTWGELKQLWNVKPKGKRNRYTSPAVHEKPKKPFQTGPTNKRTGARSLWRF